jgi:hemerythrin superfamily protein
MRRDSQGAAETALRRQVETRATDLLRADHEHISELFDQYMLALNDDPDAVNSDSGNSIGREICALLEAHSAVERELFYPAVEPEACKLVADSLRDHQDVDEAIEAFAGMGDDEPDRESTMLRIMELVGQHVAEEEEILFPLVEERLPDLLRAIVPAMLARKEEYAASSLAN